MSYPEQLNFLYIGRGQSHPQPASNLLRPKCWLMSRSSRLLGSRSDWLLQSLGARYWCAASPALLAFYCIPRDMICPVGRFFSWGRCEETQPSSIQRNYFSLLVSLFKMFCYIQLSMPVDGNTVQNLSTNVCNYS